MARSSFAKIADTVEMKPVIIEKIVRRRMVETVRPKKSKTDPAVRRAQNEGRFLDAMRALADLETSRDVLSRALSERSLAGTVSALRRTEHDTLTARTALRALPRCTEKDIMVNVLNLADERVSAAWDWVIERSAELEGSVQSKKARQRRRRNKHRQ